MPTSPSTKPRRLLLVVGIALLTLPLTHAAPPPAHVDGRTQLTDTHLESDSANLSHVYTHTTTVANKLNLGNASDATLERTIANRIDSNAALNVTRSASTGSILTSYVTGDSANRVTLDAAGKLCLGPGNGAVDTCLERASAGVWTTTSQIKSATTGTSGGYLVGDDGLLYDGGTDLLQTPDSLRVDGQLSLPTTGSSAGILIGNEHIYDAGTSLTVAPNADYILRQNGASVLTSTGSGAAANTLYLDQGKVGIGGGPNSNQLVHLQGSLTPTGSSVSSALKVQTSFTANGNGNDLAGYSIGGPAVGPTINMAGVSANFYGAYIGGDSWSVSNAGNAVGYGMRIDPPTGFSSNYGLWAGGRSVLGNNIGLGSLAPAANAGVDDRQSVTASSEIARGVYERPTLTAAANNDKLVSHDISPNFVKGTNTGVDLYGIRVDGSTWSESGSLTNTDAYAIYANAPGFAGTSNYAVYTGGGRSAFKGGASGTGFEAGQTVTAAGGLSRGVLVSTSHSASANSDQMYGIHVDQDVTTNGFGSLTAYGVKIDSWDANINNYGLHVSGPTGSGTNYAIYSASGTNKFVGDIVSAGNVGTTATTGFMVISYGAGAPSGTPTAGSGAMYLDTTNMRLYLYVNGVSGWRYASLT